MIASAVEPARDFFRGESLGASRNAIRSVRLAAMLLLSTLSRVWSLDEGFPLYIEACLCNVHVQTSAISIFEVSRSNQGAGWR